MAWQSRSPRPARLAAIVAAAAGFAAFPASAQPQDARVIAPGTLGPATPDRGLSPDQIAPTVAAPDAAQISRRRGAEPVPPPLAGPATAAGSDRATASAVSTTRDSRPLPTAALTGRDRCDPARRDKDRPVVCRRTVESRADEFSRPEIDLRDDQGLTLRTNPLLLDPEDIRRRASAAGSDDRRDADDRVTQALASIVLGQDDKPSPPPAGAPPAPPSGLEDVIGKLMDPTGSGTTPPPPTTP